MGSPAPPTSSTPLHLPASTLNELPPSTITKSSPWSSITSNEIAPATKSNKILEIIDGVAKVTIPEDLLKNSQPLWTNYIVGYFIGEAPHIGKVHATVNRIWTTMDKSTKIDAQFLTSSTVLFRIEDSNMRQRVLRRKYWHIGDVPLVVQEWNPKAKSLKPDLSSMPIWVDFLNVPDYLYSARGLQFLGNTVGEYKKLHPNTERCIRLDVARMLVVVNLENPLPNKIALNDECESLISINYPWLPVRCPRCEAWGHSGTDCELVKKGSVVILSKGANRTLPPEGKNGGVVATEMSTSAAPEQELRDSHAKDQGHQTTIGIGKEKEVLIARDETEQWKIVTKNGKSSPKKGSPKIVANPIQENGVPLNIDSVSPSRFNILSSLPEEEAEGKEEGELVEEQRTTTLQGDESSSSAEDISLRQPTPRKKKSQKNQKEKTTSKKKLDIENDQRVATQNHQNKKSSSRRN